MVNLIRLKKETYKLVSFAASGVFSAGIDCIVYYILLNFAAIDFRLIQPISMSVGLLCSFLFNRFVSFKNEKHSIGIEIAKYMAVCAVIVALSPVIISFYHIWFGEYMVKIPATLTTGFLNYVLNRFFVYNDISIMKIYEKIEDRRGNNKWDFIN